MQQLPIDVIHEISYYLSFADYVSLALTTKRFMLLQPQTLKRYFVAKFENDSDIMILFLIRNIKNPLLSQVYDCFLSTPGSCSLKNLDQSYIIQICISANQNGILKLLKAVAEQNKPDPKLDALYKAVVDSCVKTGNVDILKALKDAYKVSISAVVNPNWFFGAVCSKNVALISYLILNDAPLPDNSLVVIEYLSHSKQYSELFHFLKRLLRENRWEDSIAQYCWYCAVTEVRPEFLQFLLEECKMPPSFLEYHALRWSIRVKSVEMLSLLFRFGLSVEEAEEQKALFFAVRSRNYDTVKLLLHHGHRITKYCVDEGVKNGNMEIVKLLSEHCSLFIEPLDPSMFVEPL